jgi:hypothetical protein
MVDGIDHDTDVTVPLFDISLQCVQLVIQYLQHNEQPMRLEEALLRADADLSRQQAELDRMQLNKAASTEAVVEVQKQLEEAEKAVAEWNTAFIQGIKLATLWDFVIAVDYLHCQRLMNYACAFIGKLVKGKKADEMRRIFGIVNDLTPDEIANIRKENEWVRQYSGVSKDKSSTD